MRVRIEGRSRAAATLAVVVLGVAVSAWGRGFARHGAGAPDDEGPPGPFGGPLQELIFPCRAGCFDADHTCHDAAHATATTCVELSCAPAPQSAQAACQADRASQDCEDARGTLLQCAQTCLETARAAMATCHTTLETCLDTCGDT